MGWIGSRNELSKSGYQIVQQVSNNNRQEDINVQIAELANPGKDANKK